MERKGFLKFLPPLLFIGFNNVAEFDSFSLGYVDSEAPFVEGRTKGNCFFRGIYLPVIFELGFSI